MTVAEQSHCTAAEISDRVRKIAEARDFLESEVFERALERGLEDVWEDLVLAQCLDGELDREETIEHVGRTKVERAERDVLQSDNSGSGASEKVDSAAVRRLGDASISN